MQRFFHFTITSDARRQLPKMILERLAEEYLWQGHEQFRGTASVKNRAKRIRQLIEAEVEGRNVQSEFSKLLSRKSIEERKEHIS